MSESSKNEESTTNESKIRFLEQSINQLLHWSNSAETRANFILTIESIVIAVVLSGILSNPAGFSDLIPFSVPHFALILFGISLSISFLFCIRVIYPRKSKESTWSKTLGLYYYDTIREDYERIKDDIDALSEEQIVDAFTYEIFTLSKVLHRKFEDIRWSLIFLTIAFLSLIVSLVFTTI